MERSFVIIKPDAIQRGLVGEIIERIEKKGLKLVGMKMIRLDDNILNEHYSHLSDKPFFQEIKDFMMSTPVIVTCWEGVECVSTIRRICGITKSREAEPGTIRGDLGMSIQANLIHASDSYETAKDEIKRFFNEDELYSYSQVNLTFIYSKQEIGR